MKLSLIQNFSYKYKVSKDNNQSAKNSVNKNLSPLSFDTVSFKAMKKSQFSEIDRFVVEKFKVPIEKREFQVVDDLQTWAKKEIDVIKNKNYTARLPEICEHRSTTLIEWYDYLSTQNKYPPTVVLLILSGITSNLGANNDNIPLPLNKEILANTINQIDKILANNSKETLSFLNLYQKNLTALYSGYLSNGKNSSQWVVIPSQVKDPENFESNVEKLKVLSYKMWCTKSHTAREYLKDADFHIFLENGQPKLCFKFIDDEVIEVQGEKNNDIIPKEYIDVLKKYSENNNLIFDDCIKRNIGNAEKVKQISDKVRAQFGESFKFKTLDDVVSVFNFFGVPSQIDGDGVLNTNLFGRETKNYQISTDKLDDDFVFTQLLEILDEKEIFENSKAKLAKSIKLETIKDAEFVLNHFGIKTQKISDNALSIDEYRQPSLNFKFSDLGIDENKFFKYISEISNDASFMSSSVTDLGILKRIGQDAFFSHSQITDLGELVEIGKDSYFQHSKISNLGKLQKIGRNAYFEDSKIQDLGMLTQIGGSVFFRNSLIQDLKNLSKIGNCADFGKSSVINLGQLNEIGGNADFCNSQITDLGNLSRIGGNADFRKSKITNLGNIKEIGKNLYLGDIKLKVSDLLRIHLPAYNK